ncbi:MerR family transcriptional regulator [Thioalkalivibrio sp. HL-Eb18]|jgi:DNA-binding transcriptional MerR regulator|uniref:MerR family transcriptional regulator n=1 Tax=Thioalkalivibrio sp. HL-Eb18 TaxID=1266913 RepID=UPI00035C0DA0|nr:MerR family transcriptional regulator [Thioalkalivibrio sp. HL-Eb18]
MASATQLGTSEQEGLYPIRHVCAETGINDVTLRAWERRYGLIRPMRTPKGHRLYSADDIARIKRILELLDQGIPVSQVHRVLASENAITEIPPSSHTEAEAPADRNRTGTSKPGIAPHTLDPLAEALYASVAELDVGQLERTYARLVMRHGWNGVHESAFLEVYRRLREESRHSPEGEVRLAVFAAWATAAFSDQLRAAIRACEGPSIPCLVLGGGHQQVGGMLLQLACARRGLKTLPLFDATSPQALEALVQRLSAPAVIIHGSSQLMRSPELPRVEAILSRPGPRCYLAGSAALELAQMDHQREIEVLPGAPLEAAELLSRQLPH